MASLQVVAEASERVNSDRPTKAEHLKLIMDVEKQDKWDSSSITKEYHRLRAENLTAFKEKLTDNQQEKLKMDATRVKRCRAKLEESKNDLRRLLLGEVRESFEQWRTEREEKERERKASAPFRFPSISSKERAAHCKDMNFTDVYDKSLKDDADPAHDFKAGFLFFKKHGIGWKKTNYHEGGFDLHEEFPNQKLTVHEALHDTQSNPISETKADDGTRHLKYIHLPANHMGWVEQAIARYHEEHQKPKSHRRMTKQTLAREFWRGQVHGGELEKHPIHTWHLRTRCLAIPLDAVSNAGTGMSFHFQAPDQRRKNFAIFLPYLHWEMYGRKKRMAETVQKAIKASGQAPGKANNVEHKKSEAVMNEKVRNREIFGTILRKDEPIGTEKDTFWEVVQRARFEVKSKLGTYLMKVAKLWEAMDTEAEERLLMHGLKPQRIDEQTTSERDLHIRRTLDQSYFLNLEDTTRRDRDQVIYRATRLPWYRAGNLVRIVMVDQLWLWILDDYTIITAFPRRWGRNKPDSSGIHKSLRDRLNRMDGEVTSVWHLATIIIDQCSRVFFDRTKPLDLRPEVMDLFAESLNNVNERTTIAYETFWEHAGSLKRGKGRPNPRYLSINPEGVLLREAQDIFEELRMMTRIYMQQLGAVEGFRSSLLRWNKERGIRHHKPTRDIANGSQRDTSMDIEVIEETMEQIRARKAEIEELAGAAERSCQNLQGLLALKQQQASIVEAKAALERADHSVKQQQLSIELTAHGQKQAEMSNKLSEQSYQQGKSIMAFTIMTIIFTPLGFFTSFFGMNNSSTGQDWMPLWEQIITMVLISALIISIFLVAAFSTRFRNSVETAKNRLLKADPYTVEEGLHVIAGVSSLKLQNKPRSSADGDTIRRFQQQNAALEGRAQTFFNANQPISPVQSQLGNHGSWKRPR